MKPADGERLLRAYYDMLLIRRFEEKVGQFYGQGLIGGYCHLYIGQEAVAVGIQHALTAGDNVITSYRDHGFMLAAGSCPKSIMAELLGRSGGCSAGKGGSMHMFDVQRGFYGGHGIVAAQVPLGTGIALAQKYKQQNNLTVTCFGDGAVNQGQVYETFNMAKLWNLPVLYVIENNEYAMGTEVKRASYSTDLYQRGLSFGIEGEQVDGMSYQAVYQSTQRAVQKIKSGHGPYIMEMKTYRYRGHSMSDPAKYRSKEEVQMYKEKFDPMERLRSEAPELIDEQKIILMEKQCKTVVQEAAEFALASPEPNLDQLYTNVYREGVVNG